MKRNRERVPGGLAAGMRPLDFDPVALAEGTRVEMEHTSDPEVAQEIAMDHLMEDPDYYTKLRSIHVEPNRGRGRVRVVDAEEIAKKTWHTFTGRKEPPAETRFKFDWHVLMQHVGDSLGVAYSSDKWYRDWTLFKHIAESRNRVLCRRGFLRAFNDHSRPWPVIGPMVSFADVPMPKQFAVLARFEEANLVLHQHGTDRAPQFARAKDEGVVTVEVRHGMLGGGLIQWTKTGVRRKDTPFLFVYTEDDGVKMLIVGEELAIEKDGIVG
jgi:hypothetical protein